MSTHNIVERLSLELSPKRLRHSLGVAETARQLAIKHGVDAHKAELAGLLHDCARDLTVVEAMSLYHSERLTPEPYIDHCPELLHSLLGPVLARRLYGVTDEDICYAIRCHTTGLPKMGNLDKILFLADKIEPGQRFRGIGTIRSLADTCLDQAMLAVLDHSIRNLLFKEKILHTATIQTRNALLIQIGRRYTSSTQIGKAEGHESQVDA